MAELKNGAMTIQRADVLDGLQALYLAQYRFNRLLKEDSYTCGYKEGFEDALQTIAQMIGLADEFQSIKRQPGHLEVSPAVIPHNGTRR